MKKRVNKKKSSNRRRTFRRKHGLNLARKSLKNIFNKKHKGGAKVDELPKVVEPTTVAEPIVQEPVVQEPIVQEPDNGSTNITHNIEEPVAQVEPVPEPVTEVEPITPEPEPVPEPITEVEPVTQEPVPEPVTPEPITEVETVTPEPVTEVETVTPETITPKPEPMPEPEPITQEPIKPNDPELSQAVETVVKYFSDAITNSVEKKVAEKLDQPNDEGMQNGFDSINQEVNKMAVGGKKTRKFRITNKNKSIHKRV